MMAQTEERLETAVQKLLSLGVVQQRQRILGSFAWITECQAGASFKTFKVIKINRHDASVVKKFSL